MIVSAYITITLIYSLLISYAPIHLRPAFFTYVPLSKSRLARECCKLDPAFEKALAEEGLQNSSN